MGRAGLPRGLLKAPEPGLSTRRAAQTPRQARDWCSVTRQLAGGSPPRLVVRASKRMLVRGIVTETRDQPKDRVVNAAGRRKRILIGKVGLDGHDRGAKFIVRALRDAGYEVIYTGIRRTPEQIVRTAIDEDVDAIGLSMLSGAHNELFARVAELLKAEDAETIALFAGGIIPQQDIPHLKSLGFRRVFTPGSSLSAILSGLEEELGGPAATGSGASP